MRRIKLTIVATCAAVAAATTVTPAYAMDDPEQPDTSTALSEGIKEYGLLATVKGLLFEIVTFPIVLSVMPILKAGVPPK